MSIWNKNHLSDSNMNYITHWYRAMKLSIALFIHAFIPPIMSDYASKELEKKD